MVQVTLDPLVRLSTKHILSLAQEAPLLTMDKITQLTVQTTVITEINPFNILMLKTVLDTELLLRMKTVMMLVLDFLAVQIPVKKMALFQMGLMRPQVFQIQEESLDTT